MTLFRGLRCGFGNGCLTGLAAHIFTEISDAFALVWLGWAERTKVGGYLADQLLVDTAENDDVLVLLILTDLDAFPALKAIR